MLPLSHSRPFLTHEVCMAVDCKNEARALCSECLKAAYCSSLCLRNDWGDHQNFCRKSEKKYLAGRTAKEMSIISPVARLLENYSSRGCSTSRIEPSEENIALCKSYFDQNDIVNFLSALWRVFPDRCSSLEEDLSSPYARLLEEGMLRGSVFCAYEYLVFLAVLFSHLETDENRQSILTRARATGLLVTLCENMDCACCSSWATVQWDYMIVHNTYDKIIKESSFELHALLKAQDPDEESRSRGLAARYFMDHFSQKLRENAPTFSPPTWLNQTGIKAAFLVAEQLQANTVFTGDQISRVRQEVIGEFLSKLETF